MTIHNINITASNGTHLYPVKASIGEPTYDYIQCSPSEAEGIAVLRYIPSVAEIVAGEFYANGTALKSFIKFPVDLTVVNVPTVDVYVSTTDPVGDPLYIGWIKVGNSLSSVGTQFGLLGSDVPVNSSIWVMVKDTASSVNAISLPSERRGIITILTLNNDDPLEFAGIYTENTKYFYGANGAIVEGTDSGVTSMFYGIGNADKMIDLDIKDLVIEIDPITLVAGTEGNVTGTYNGNTGWTLNVYRRLLPDGLWELFDSNVAVDEFGAWTATGTVPDAGTYNFKAIANDNSTVIGYEDDVVVASGVVLTALQITNASDAGTKNSIFIKETKLAGDNILAFCITTSSKIKIGNTSYSTGLGTTNAIGRCFIVSITKNHTVNWINFYDWDYNFNETESGNVMWIDGNYVFTIDQYKPSSNVVSKLHKISLSDGTESTLSLTAGGGHSAAFCIGGIYDSDIIVGGRDLSVQYGRSVFWKVKKDLSGQTVHASGFSGSLLAYKLNAHVAFNTHIFSNGGGGDGALYLIEPSSSWGAGGAGNNNISYVSHINIGDMTSSSSRVLFFISASSTVVGTRLACYTVSGTTLTQKWVNHFTGTQNLQGRAIFDGTNFVVLHRTADDGNGRRQFTIRKIADSNSYTEIGVVSTIGNSGDNTVEILYGCGLDVDATHYVVAGQVTGAFESGFSVGDNTKKDVWIKLIEK